MRPHSIAPTSSMRRGKGAGVSSSAIPSRWSTQPSRVTLMLKVKIPMAPRLLGVEGDRWTVTCRRADARLTVLIRAFNEHGRTAAHSELGGERDVLTPALFEQFASGGAGLDDTGNVNAVAQERIARELRLRGNGASEMREDRSRPEPILETRPK